MHDIKRIRENPADFDKAMARRGLPPQTPEILKIDEKLREVTTKLQNLQAERNAKSKEIGHIKSKKGDADTLMSEVNRIKDHMAALEVDQARFEEELKYKLSILPQILAQDVPEGKDESQNRLEHTWGSIPKFAFEPKQHFDLGESLGLMDFDRAAKISGARFVFLKGALVRLERALSQFMLDLLTQEFGFTEMLPPYLVNDSAMYGTGHLPKFKDDQFHTTDGRWLIPTSEVVLTNYHADEILSADELPKRYCAYTLCFRSEAGSAGRDTRGMIRNHQFTKVEMVCVTKPEDSDSEHRRMLKASETILQRLNIPYRVVTLCTGDTGAWSTKTFDLEVWLPGQNAYREISSVSNCGDYQARRMKLRYKEKDGKNTILVHTLNGSALAVGRTLIAVMENYQQPNGSIKIPDVLKPYLAGLESIVKPGI